MVGLANDRSSKYIMCAQLMGNRSYATDNQTALQKQCAL